MCGDWGLPPGRAAALIALALIADYSDGAFFPKGGGGALLEALVDAAEGHGATFRANVAARRILVSRGHVTGVELEDGETLMADVGFRFRIRTPVEGLFLAGQGVVSMGISPSLLSGRLAAQAAERFTERRGRLRHHLGEGRTWHSEAEAPPF
jgi:phytoene dehydrogenase-like protein